MVLKNHRVAQIHFVLLNGDVFRWKADFERSDRDGGVIFCEEGPRRHSRADTPVGMKLVGFPGGDICGTEGRRKAP